MEDEVRNDEKTLEEEESAEDIDAYLDEDDEELDDEYWDDEESESDSERFTVRVFLHTGTSLTPEIKRGTNVLTLRRILDSDFGRPTYGSTVLLNGRPVATDYEQETYIHEGDMVVMSGSVKGG